MADMHQVFVSYAHADDQPMDDNVPGWVSYFVDKLQRTVARQPGGAQVTFWMDHRLEPQRRVDDELRRRISDSSVILALISPRYLESNWCAKEMATFVEEVGGGLSDNRVFMVELLPTERPSWHPAVQELSPVQLWSSSLNSPEPKTKGWPVPDARCDRDYWDDVHYLASVLARQIKGLSNTNGLSDTTTLLAEDSLAPSFNQQSQEVEPSSDGPLSIALTVADDEDASLVSATQVLLGELDADAYVPPKLSPGQLPSSHRAAVEQQLRSSHGVLLVYGTAPLTWVHAKHAEVRKLLALERSGIWTGLLEGPPAQKPSHGLPPRGLLTLDCKGGVSKDELGRFVHLLQEQRRGANFGKSTSAAPKGGGDV